MIKSLGSITLAAAIASSAGIAVAQVPAGTTAERRASETGFAQFTPRPSSKVTRLDYTIWDEALKSFVLRMGDSLREGAPRPATGLGSRVLYGHDSRYRLEGNRVGFGFLEPEAIAALSAYRADLEVLGGQIDIASLPRNEQLAYWLNLHNVAVIEQIARAYPVRRPADIRINGSNVPLDETPFITVAGVAMSPKDIRTRIVYPNWNSPKVIYGFFRGEIGGPSIDNEAFTGRNVSDMLDMSAKEFVNSLRGTQKSGKTLQVSKLYIEAKPFYFRDWPGDIRRHILAYAKDDVTALLNATSGAEPAIYELDIADLSKGHPDPGLNTIYSNDRMASTRIPADVTRLLTERQQKHEKAVSRGERRGTVRVIDIGLPEKPPEVVE